MAAYSEELKNGGSATYTYTFSSISTDYVKLGLKVNDVFVDLPNNGRISGWSTGDPEYPWSLDTTTKTISFSGTLTPAGTENLRVFRETSLDSLPITFTAGSALSADQLNENFQLVFDVSQEINSQYLTASTGQLQQNLDADSNKIVNLANGTAATDAVNKSQLDSVATGAATERAQAEAAAQLAQDWAISASNPGGGSEKSAKTYAGEAETSRAWIEANDNGTLRDTIFWGFRRTAAGNLLIDYTPSTTAGGISKETANSGSATYKAKDYYWKGSEHWSFMPAGSIDQGTNLPRLSFSNGHLNYDI